MIDIESTVFDAVAKAFTAAYPKGSRYGEEVDTPGKGYSTDFVDNMNAVVHRLRHVPGEKIRLTFGPDSLCACCPHNTDGLCDTQDKVSRFDRKTVEYFDLHEGEYIYQDLIRAIDAQMTPAMLEDICRGCAWYPVSACKKNICGK